MSNTQEEEEEEEGGAPKENSHESNHMEEEAHEEGASPFHLSLHAVHGTSSVNQTFTLLVHMGKLKGTAVVDIGSKATFIDTEMAIKLHVKFKITQQ